MLHTALDLPVRAARSRLRQTAEERKASLIVLGSHRRSGLVGRLLGSVAAAVVTHSRSSVLVVHERS